MPDIEKMLAVYKKIRKQGIDPDQVERFGFSAKVIPDDEYATLVEENRDDPNYRPANPHAWEIIKNDGKEQIVIRYYNIAKMKNGDVVILDPPVQKSEVHG